MQSSTLVALRSLVMLICLAAVPVFALVGTDGWPIVWKKFVAWRNSVLEDWAEETGPPVTALASTDTPHKAATVSRADQPATSAPREAIPSNPPLQNSAPAAAAPIQSNATGARSPTDATANNSPPANPPSLPSPAFWPGDPSRSAEPARGSATNAGGQQSNGFDNRATPAAFVSQSPTGSAMPVAGQTADQLQARLQSLGALHYRLETAGANGELYRFRCKMGLPTNPNYNRYFEATDADALRAMQQVVSQIEAWRSER